MRLLLPMDLQKDYLLSSLLTLRPTEEHLKSLACYIKMFENQEQTIVEGIRFAHQISGIHHRITLYYLVNEVLCMPISTRFKVELKQFINEMFISDIEKSLKFEILNKKLLELESVWNRRKILTLGIDLEEILLKIKESFFDRPKLIKVLKDLLESLEEAS